jgi:hypothetical protein
VTNDFKICIFLRAHIIGIMQLNHTYAVPSYRTNVSIRPSTLQPLEPNCYSTPCPNFCPENRVAMLYEIHVRHANMVEFRYDRHIATATNNQYTNDAIAATNILEMIFRDSHRPIYPCLDRMCLIVQNICDQLQINHQPLSAI